MAGATTTTERPVRAPVTLSVRADLLAAWRRLVPAGERSGHVERMIEGAVACAQAEQVTQ